MSAKPQFLRGVYNATYFKTTVLIMHESKIYKKTTKLRNETRNTHTVKNNQHLSEIHRRTDRQREGREARCGTAVYNRKPRRLKVKNLTSV